MITFEQLEEYINRCAYNEKQKQDALSKIEEKKPKIKTLLACFTYNRDYGKELSVVTSPDLDIKLRFEKDN